MLQRALLFTSSVIYAGQHVLTVNPVGIAQNDFSPGSGIEISLALTKKISAIENTEIKKEETSHKKGKQYKFNLYKL